MGIFARVAQVMSANFNALIDKAEDPRKNLNQTLVEMREQIVAARKEVVSSVAAEKQLKKRVEELDREVEQWTARAELAVSSHDDALAREALLQKRRSVGDRDRAEAARAEQRASALERRDALEQMERKVKEFELRKNTIATRAEQAKAGGGVEGLGKQGSGPGAFEEFRRMEERIEGVEHTVLAQSEVDAVLDGRGPGGMSRAEVEAKFRALETGGASSTAAPAASAKSEVEDELLALKKKIRIEI